KGIRAALGSPNLAVRYMAMAKLRGMPAKDGWGILGEATFYFDNPVLRARALWQLTGLDYSKGLGGSDSEAMAGALIHVMTEKHERCRVWSERYLKDGTGKAGVLNPNGSDLAKMLKADLVAVRREALLTLRDQDPTQARQPILELAKKYDGKDRFYLCA